MLLLSDMDLSLNNEGLKVQIVEKLYNDLPHFDKVTIDELFKAHNITSITESVNEAFWDKLTKRVGKATEVSKVISDKAENILKGMLNKASKAVDFVNKLLNAFKDLINNVIIDVKDTVSKKLGKDGKFTNKVKEVFEKDKNAFTKDLKTAKEVYSFYKKDFSSNILKHFKNNLGKFFSKEHEPIPESYNYGLNEGKNVLSTFIHGVEKIPPFSWLHKVASIGEKGTGKIIEGISFITDKLGGPKFTLPTIAVLIGVAFEYKIKGSVKSGILSIFGDAFTGGFLSVISWIATFIAAVIVIDQVTGNKIMEH